MAEKRYYWLKLKEDYLSSPKIKKLRKIAGGDTFTIIYLKMQLLSIRNGGLLTYEGIEQSFNEELALKLDEDAENVSVTLAYLKAQGLIEENSSGEYFLSEASNNIGSEGASAERKRVFDSKKKNEALLCNGSVTSGNASLYLISNSNSNSISISKSNKEDMEDKVFDEYKVTETLKEIIKGWLDYKKEKRQTYKESGLKGLVSRLVKEAEEKGEDFVKEEIVYSISQNYSGIYPPDTKKQPTYKTRQQERHDNFFDNLKAVADSYKQENKTREITDDGYDTVFGN